MGTWLLDWVVVVWVLPKILLITEHIKHIQIRELLADGHWFYKMQAMINVTQPLKKCLHLQLGRYPETCGLLRFERLPIGCYHYGRIDHIQAIYTHPQESDEAPEIPYDEWLIAATNASWLI